MPYAKIKTLVHRTTGIELGEDKDYLIEARLGPLLTSMNFASYDALADAVVRDSQGNLRAELIERIATHETLFFRDESIFTALTTQIIPEWLARNSVDRPLRIWCAACATGQEPYSILMLIKESLPHVFDRVKMTATDISEATVARARLGIYSQFDVGRGLPAAYSERFFRPMGENFQVIESIRNAVNFKQGNLLDLPYEGAYDIVFCRNVLVYFDMATRVKILEALRKCMNPDSTLILGSSESLFGITDDYVLRQCGLARYYEWNTSKITIFKRPNSQEKI
ncbi:MAG: protein-glutamate O-methyltransferase CheR [Leptospirales bacterium]|nr:protein-glutamate O-methyltransferase CheR [Leptospirales bacterium]